MIYYQRIFITPFTALETMRIFFIFLLLTVLCGCQPRKFASLKPLPLKVTTISPETLTLTSKSDRLVLRAGSSAAILNKVAIQLDHPVQCDADGNWSLHPGTIRDILLPVLDKTPRRIKTILLDPGHGGHDNGTVSASGVKEKEALKNQSFLIFNILLGFENVKVSVAPIPLFACEEAVKGDMEYSVSCARGNCEY